MYNIEVIFNAPYSSEYNPIERLWAYSKRAFRKHLIAFTDYKSQPKIESLVRKSIEDVETEGIGKHVLRCRARMLQFLAENESTITN